MAAKKITNRPVRIDVSKKDIRLAYKFISGTAKLVDDNIYTAQIVDLSCGGMQFKGIIPHHLTLALAEGDVLLGCNIFIPDNKIKTLAHVRWLASDVKTSEGLLHRVGVQFIDLDKENKVKLQSYLIKNQIVTNRLHRSREMLLDPKYIGDV